MQQKINSVLFGGMLRSGAASLAKMVFRNIHGDAEIILSFKTRNNDCIIYSAEIQHNPFYANLEITYTIKELEYMVNSFNEMYAFRITQFAISSFNRDLFISFFMEETGHITASVAVDVSFRGNLEFEFDFDQSFIPEIIEQVKPRSKTLSK